MISIRATSEVGSSLGLDAREDLATSYCGESAALLEARRQVLAENLRDRIEPDESVRCLALTQIGSEFRSLVFAVVATESNVYVFGLHPLGLTRLLSERPEKFPYGSVEICYRNDKLWIDEYRLTPLIGELEQVERIVAIATTLPAGALP